MMFSRDTLDTTNFLLTKLEDISFGACIGLAIASGEFFPDSSHYWAVILGAAMLSNYFVEGRIKKGHYS